MIVLNIIKQKRIPEMAPTWKSHNGASPAPALEVKHMVRGLKKIMYRIVRTTLQPRELHSVYCGDLNAKSKRKGVYG